MSESYTPGPSVGAGGGDEGKADPSAAQREIVEAEDDRPMTFEEKSRLSLGINMLPGPALCKIIDIITTLQPSRKEDDQNEFVIDFEELNPSILRALERFVKSKVPMIYEDDM